MVYDVYISMKVFISEEAGFCFGVKRALILINQLHRQKQCVQIYGDLIHNNTVLKDLEKKGINCIKKLDDASPGKKIVIRTHGIPLQEEEALKEAKMDYLDATCPLVKKIHEIIQKNQNTLSRIVIVGDKNHPEIIAARSYAKNATVINSITQAEKIKPSKEIIVIAQTTLDSEFFKKIVFTLIDKAEKLKIHNTICEATRVRQRAIQKLAPTVDFVVVIGGKNSSNTKKLYDISNRKNKNTFYFEKSEDLYNRKFINQISNYKSVGITAGASTPPDEIEKVKNFFQNFKEIKNGKLK